MFHHARNDFQISPLKRQDTSSDDVLRLARRAFRRTVREKAAKYDRRRLLPALIYCPVEWLTSNGGDVNYAILRRLSLALYQQRQARAIRHYTFSQGRYEALLVAIGGELRIRNALTMAPSANARPI